MLKLMKRANIYKNSTGTNTFNPATMTATSYDWWTYLKVIDGLIVFNTFVYSPTTRKHQRELLNLLEELGIKPDVYIQVPRGLDNLSSGRTYYAEQIDKVEQALVKGRASKREERLSLIETYKSCFNYINNFIEAEQKEVRG